MSRLINTANINYVKYIEHEVDPWFEYRPPGKYLWLIPYDEHWEIPWARESYSREDIYKNYPDYEIDNKNNVVRKDPILYIYMNNGDKITVKTDAKFTYEVIMRRLGENSVSTN